MPQYIVRYGSVGYRESLDRPYRVFKAGESVELSDQHARRLGDQVQLWTESEKVTTSIADSSDHRPLPEGAQKKTAPKKKGK